ncbi:MAG TPA: MarR family transcriptional regulator [Thermoplasmata archaeon]|nr:MarR family transcriptional regulator [Thermoplasmata archaeon]
MKSIPSPAPTETSPLEGTRGKVLGELAAGPKTARDLARLLGIQESAARGHLDRLEERGWVVPTFRREGVGRPRKRYALTAEGQEQFPKKYDLMVDAIVDGLLAHEGEGYASAILAEAGERVARVVAHDVAPGKDPEEKARNLVTLLNRLGFRSHVERAPDGRLRVVRTNCVFRHSALAHPFLLCDVFDKHLTEALLGEVGIDLEDSIGRGGLRCSHLIQLA